MSSPPSPQNLSIKNEFYRQVCEHMGVALIVVDQASDILAWNGAATRMFGASQKQMLGSKVCTVLPHEHREKAVDAFRRAIDTGENSDFEFDLRNSHGQCRELIATVAPVVSHEGELIGASACIRDITHRIALQNELNEARKLSALGELAGAVAHHFSNILGGIITHLDFARTTHNASITSKAIDRTVESLQRATTLIEGLLMFSAEDRHAHTFIDLGKLIDEFAEEVALQADQSGVEFDLQVPSMPPIIPVPQKQVLMLLRNVVDNAFEAMEHRAGKLIIQVQPDDAWVVITIADTGCGIDEAAQSRIFEPFWTTKDDRVRLGTGTSGLGLAVAHGIAHVLGGSISVNSTLGKGTSFEIRIPRTPATPVSKQQ